MAVKPITNKQVVSTANINRGEQTSTRNTTNRSGNRAQTITPGNNLSDNYEITLKDIDSAVLNHVQKIIRPKVKEANETVDVTVMYGNEERWKSFRKRGVLRDKNGAFILPLIMMKRTTVDRSSEMPMNFEHDVKRENIEVIRNNQWSKKNRYDRFNYNFYTI